MNRAAVVALRYFAFAFISSFPIGVVVCPEGHIAHPMIDKMPEDPKRSTHHGGKTAQFSGFQVVSPIQATRACNLLATCRRDGERHG